MKGNVLIAQSGGPTAVINNTVFGIADYFRKNDKDAIVYAGTHGVEGILEKKLFSLSDMSDARLEKLKGMPSAGLGSCRYKLSDEIVDGEGDYDKLLEVFKEFNIRYFFYIGGNDSMDSAYKVHELAQQADYEMCALGVPKTVDNDLVKTDHCPGFGSAAKYVANSALEIWYDINSYPKKQVGIIEAMGRDAGWITGAAALAGKAIPDMQQLIYLPETDFEENRFVSDVENALKQSDYVMVVASEGLRYANGEYIDVGDTVDDFGHMQLGGMVNELERMVSDNIDTDTRAITLNALQRSAMHCVSGNDKDEAELVGREAARMALEGKSGVMAALERTSEDPYEYNCIVRDVDLDTVRNEVKPVPKDWIGKDLCSVTNEFIHYVAPLIRGTVNPFEENGLITAVNPMTFRYKEDK